MSKLATIWKAGEHVKKAFDLITLIKKLLNAKYRQKKD